MSKHPPKQNSIPKGIIPKQTKPLKHQGLVFSFQNLEFNEYFSLDGTCVNWPTELFDMMKDVSSLPWTELVSGTYKKYRVHSHENSSPPISLPDHVEKKDFYQIRISKSKGGIHGVYQDDVFYVMWLDPLHNMYPDERYGGLRKIKPGSTCCKDRDEELFALKAENAQLKRDIDNLLAD